jgi:hypothetical protein
MSADPLSCPYCNAYVAVAAGAAAGQRVPCPRCGEAFTLRPSQAPSTAVQSFPAVLPAAAPPDLDLRADRAGRGKRRTLAAVLGGMAVMAAGGLTLALLTVGERRAHDTRLPPQPKKAFSPIIIPPAEAPAPPTPPARLAALGWLPADTTLLVGIDVAELRRTDAGREALAAALNLGPVAVKADDLERWTGLRPDHIDHAVLGVKADDALPQQTVLVVRTRRPYDADAVRTALGAKPDEDAAGRAIDLFTPRGTRLRLALWCADDRTLIIGLSPEHVRAAPDQPADAAARLPEEVRTLLEQRVDPGAPAWAVGASDGWKTLAPLALAETPKEQAERLTRVRGFAVSLLPGSPPTLRAELLCADAGTAEALEKQALAARPPGGDWKAVREGDWLSLQLRGGSGELWKALGK